MQIIKNLYGFASPVALLNKKGYTVLCMVHTKANFDITTFSDTATTGMLERYLRYSWQLSPFPPPFSLYHPPFSPFFPSDLIHCSLGGKREEREKQVLKEHVHVLYIPLASSDNFVGIKNFCD